MNKSDFTSKGYYLPALNKDFMKSYKQFHNTMVDKISKYFIVLLDDNQDYIGCGIFLSFIYKNKISHFIVSAGHVISEIVKTKNIKIPINYENNNKNEQGYVISYPCISNYAINEEEDIGIIHGNFDCEKEGFEYYLLKENDEIINNVNDDVLIFGITWNRYRKATKKYFLNQSGNCIVNAFQLPTIIENIKNYNINISFPNQLFYFSPISKTITEGNSFDPHGLSGSTVWQYNSDKICPSCIIIEKSDRSLKCVSYENIKSLIIDYLKDYLH